MRPGFIALFLMAVLLVGCNPSTAASVATPTTAPTFASTPTSLIILPTATSVIPTQTPSLLMEFPKKIVFPDWMMNREANILAIPLITEERDFWRLAFIEANSLEQFDLPSSNIGGFFWLQNPETFGILSKDRQAIAIIDIPTGKVTTYPAPHGVYIDDDSNDVPVALMGFGDYSNPSDFILAQPEKVSRDGKFVVHEYYYWDIRTTSIGLVDTKTGEELQLSVTTNVMGDFEGQWSPVSSHYASVKYQGCEMTMPSPQCKKYDLQIYEAPTGNMIDSYQDIANFSWSHDGLQFVHTKNPNFWEPWPDLNPPCIFNILEGKTTCFDEVRLQHIPKTLSIQYGWSPDMQQIGYAYSSPADDPALDQVGGFCLLSIQTRKIDCPIESFGDSQIAHAYQWSPNGNFVALHLEARGYGGDNGNVPRLAILNVHTRTYETVGGYDKEVDVGALGLWRPLP